MAALAHAGVLADAVNISDTKGFLRWAIDGFSGQYTWHAVADIREEPRWDSEWMAPEALKATIIGRCINALGRLGKSKKWPASWIEPVKIALDGGQPTLSAFFPGPLDGFWPASWAQRQKADIETVQRLLAGRSSFEQAPGLLPIAYSGGIDG